MGTFVYKYVLNGEIIYIGKTKDIDKRIHSHGRNGDNITPEAWPLINNADVYYIEVANSTMADVVESELIRRYKPKLNKAKMSDWSGLPFDEPKWERYYEHKKRESLSGSRSRYEKVKELSLFLHQVIEKTEDWGEWGTITTVMERIE